MSEDTRQPEDTTSQKLGVLWNEQGRRVLLDEQIGKRKYYLGDVIITVRYPIKATTLLVEILLRYQIRVPPIKLYRRYEERAEDHIAREQRLRDHVWRYLYQNYQTWVVGEEDAVEDPILATTSTVQVPMSVDEYTELETSRCPFTVALTLFRRIEHGIEEFDYMGKAFSIAVPIIQKRILEMISEWNNAPLR